MEGLEHNLKLAVPFFMVADMQVSLDFYTGYLDFKLIKEWTPRSKIEWCWLQRDGVALMLQEKRIDPSEDKPVKNEPGQGVSICFQCEDALKIYYEVTAKELTVKEPFVGNSMWVVIIKDPDGFKLDFESITDVPEGTIYSDWIKG